MECGRWEEEAVDVGHLFWKFGSNKGRKEVAQVAGSRETLLLFLQFFKFGRRKVVYCCRMWETWVCLRKQPMKGRP